MTTYRNNYFSPIESSIVCRDEGWAAYITCGWAPAPQCDRDGLAIALHIGAERYDHVATGFEYCIDAPIRMPAGSMRTAGTQPYMD